MNNVLNQNGKVLKETLAGSNSDAVKTILSGPRNLKMILSLLQVLKKPLFLSHAV